MAHWGVACLAASMAIWSVVLAVAFDYAHLSKSFDYNTLLKRLLGPFRILFEIIYIVMIFLVIAVISGAAGEIFMARAGGSHFTGIAVLSVLICVCVFLSSDFIARFMSTWSVLLYLAYGAIFFLSLTGYGREIADAIARGEVKPSWPSGAIAYAGYNLAALPATLFILSSLRNRKEAIVAGLLTGPIALTPALLFVLVLIAFMPEVLSAPVPLTYVLNAISVGPLGVFLDIVIFGTFVQTGLGGMHAINERVDAALQRQGRRLPGWGRPVISLLIYGVSLGLVVQFGLINIIANGYGVLTYGFLILLILPIMTIGLWRSIRANTL